MAYAKLPRLSHPPEQQCYQLRLSARFLPQSVNQIRPHSASFGGKAAEGCGVPLAGAPAKNDR